MTRNPYRSLFWPIVLISVGLIWFLVNINVIPQLNAIALLNLWPLLLIALGLDLIFGRRSPVIGLLIGIGTVATAVAILVAVPNLAPDNNFITEPFREPLGAATSASVRIEGSSHPVNIYALNDSDMLFDSMIGHSGQIDFNVSGTTERQITLRQRPGISIPFSFNFSIPLKWEIGLNPKVPIALTYDGASGSSNLDLSKLQLSSLNVDGGSGSLDISLPPSTKGYNAAYKGASGSLSMRMPADSDLTLRLSGASGSLSLSLPANAAVRIEVNDNGSGSFSAPGWTTRLSGKSGDDKGIWESANYSSAAHKIQIVVDNMGSGSISVH